MSDLTHDGEKATRGRALVVSHPCVVPANQSVFASLADRGWSLDLVVPNRWNHVYADGPIRPQRLSGLNARMHARRIALSGQPQRHFYVSNLNHALIHRHRAPRVAFLEEESFSMPALQWGLACWRAGIPFGVQADENLDRKLPLPARAFRAWTLQHAAFVAARSPRAKQLVEQWGARGRVEVVPHAVPGWTHLPQRSQSTRAFTIGFAGRLVEEKGVRDLVAAARRLGNTSKLLFVGDGPLREELAQATPELDVEILTDISHEEMPRAYARMDVLVLPSRTTPTWTEQFGRVLVEALWCGVPVVGSQSGEIPWVVTSTGGGSLYPEGDVDSLANILRRLEIEPDERVRLANAGRRAVEHLFSVDAVSKLLDGVLTDVARS